MSEQLRQNSEHESIAVDVSAEAEANLKRLQEAAKHTPEADADLVQSLEMAAKSEAISGNEVPFAEHEASQQSPLGMHRQLKEVSYKRSMERVRSNLSRPGRILSRLIHNPVLETISEGAGRTAGRPSGILGGAVLALIGSSTLLYLARHYGFTYNYLIFAFLYIGGFFLGLLIEGLIRLIKR
jgi:hypothetical protein